MPTLAHTISPDWFTDKGCFQQFKEFVKQMELAIQHKFDPQMPVDHLLKEKSVFIDEILISGWLHFLTDQAGLPHARHDDLSLTLNKQLHRLCELGI